MSHANLIVYCSGPLFSPEERAGMAALAAALEESGFATFLPQRDGLERVMMRLMRAPGAGARVLEPVSRLLRRAVFALDVYQVLERCDALVVNLNGRVPDEGSVVEMSLAWATGRPLVAYKQDARTAFVGYDNPMLTGLTPGFSTVSELAAVPAELEQVIKAARAFDAGATRIEGMPRQVEDAVRHGRRVWKLLEAAPALRGKPPDETNLVERLRQALEED